MSGSCLSHRAVAPRRFEESKDELDEAVRKHGAAFFAAREAHGYGGLVNQGATCYLNSLIQVSPRDRACSRAAAHCFVSQHFCLIDPATHASASS